MSFLVVDKSVESWYQFFTDEEVNTTIQEHEGHLAKAITHESRGCVYGRLKYGVHRIKDTGKLINAKVEENEPD